MRQILKKYTETCRGIGVAAGHSRGDPSFSPQLPGLALLDEALTLPHCRPTLPLYFPPNPHTHLLPCCSVALCFYTSGHMVFIVWKAETQTKSQSCTCITSGLALGVRVTTWFCLWNLGPVSVKCTPDFKDLKCICKNVKI